MWQALRPEMVVVAATGQFLQRTSFFRRPVFSGSWARLRSAIKAARLATTFKMSSKRPNTEGSSDLANRILSSSPEEMSGAEEGRETSSGIEGETSDLSLSLTGDDGSPNHTSAESRGTDTESSGEEKDSDRMEDTGHYSINDENRVHGHSDEEEKEKQPQHHVQRRRARGDQDSSDDERALEDWVSSETTALPRPRWQALPALRERELGSRARFMYEACGARGFVLRFRLQHGLEDQTGCVNTLHFNQRGTWLGCGGSPYWTLRVATKVMSSRPSSFLTVVTPPWLCVPGMGRYESQDCLLHSAARTPSMWSSTREHPTSWP